MADGNISVSKRGAHFLNLQITDKKLLYDIRRIFQSEHAIGKRSKIEKQKIRYSLQIGSREICDDLRKLGLCERKSHRLLFPKIPKVYFFDFVRGYFDGDGNVWIGLIHKKEKTQHWTIQTVFTSCSEEFLRSLRCVLERYKIKGALSCGKGFSRLYYSIHSSLELYKRMYDGRKMTLYLPRKKTVFERFIKMRT
jgi:intein-encoded DNA endonuclease-like protein